MTYLHLSAQFVIILERQSTILPSVYIGKIMQAVFIYSIKRNRNVIGSKTNITITDINIITGGNTTYELKNDC